MLTHRDTIPHVRVVSKSAGWIAICIGASVLVGWTIDSVTLKSILPSQVSMKPNAALGIILCGVALRFLQEDRLSVRAHYVASICAGATVAIGLLTLVEYAFNWEFGVDQWWFQESHTGLGTAISRRMGFNTALCLLAFGMAFLIVDCPALSSSPAQALTFLGMGGAFAALMGYAYGIESLYGIASYTPMALHTSIVLILIGVGICCARPERGWLALLIGDSVGGQVARRLLPAALLVPFVNGFLALLGERVGWYGGAFGAALVTTSGITAFGILIWWTATSLNRADERRRSAERKLELYRQMFVHSHDGIAVIHPVGHFLEQNPQHERLFGCTSEELIGRTPAVFLGEAEFQRAVEELNRTGSYRQEVLRSSKSGKRISTDVSRLFCSK